MSKGDTDRFLKATIDPLLSKQGQRISRAAVYLFRGGTLGLLGWIAVRPADSTGGLSKADFDRAIAVHEARCEQVVADAREQMRELNRRMDLLLRQRWNTPPRGGEGLMRKDNVE